MDAADEPLLAMGKGLGASELLVLWLCLLLWISKHLETARRHGAKGLEPLRRRQNNGGRIKVIPLWAAN